MEEARNSLSPEELTQKANELEEDFNRPLTEEEKAYIEEEMKKTLSYLSSYHAKDS